MDQQAVTEALSKAIIEVAQSELDRLTVGLEPQQKVERIEYALNELGGLSSSNMPEYADRWVALLYLTWYQPRQINIAYRIVKRYLDENSLGRSNELFVIDFGCGALAMQFGVALAFSDIAQLGKSTPRIRILSMDSSGDMIRIGRRAWTKFKDESHADNRLGYLSGVCDLITYATMTVPSSGNSLQLHHTWLDTPPGSYRWISAIHTVYEENLSEVRNLLQYIADSFNPDVSFITSQNYPANVRRAKEISPFENNDAYEQLDTDTPAGFVGDLPRITQWRRNISDSLESQSGITSDYLDRMVRWNYSDTNFLIYAKEYDDLPW